MHKNVYHTIYMIYFFQQEHVLAELKEYSSSTPEPKDAASVNATHQYLQGCHFLFERGILNSGVSLNKPDGFIIQQMDKGHQCLTSWLDRLLSEGTMYMHAHCTHTCTCMGAHVYTFSGHKLLSNRAHASLATTAGCIS